MKYKILGLSIAIITISAITLALKSGFSKNENTLVIGTVADYAPWVSTNENGQFEGFDIDVIEEIAKKLNKKLIIKDLGSMTSLFLALEQGSIDAIIWGLSITKDRLEKIAMIRYQGENVKSFPLIFWKKIPEKIKDYNSLNNSGLIICVEPASSQESVLNRFKGINKKSTEKVDDALLNLQYGKVDAAFVEPAIAKKFKNKYPEIQTLDIPLNADEQVFGVGICIKKDNTKLINQIQEAVNESEKEIKEFEKKWDIS